MIYIYVYIYTLYIAIANDYFVLLYYSKESEIFLAYELRELRGENVMKIMSKLGKMLFKQNTI